MIRVWRQEGIKDLGVMMQCVGHESGNSHTLDDLLPVGQHFQSCAHQSAFLVSYHRMGETAQKKAQKENGPPDSAHCRHSRSCSRRGPFSNSASAPRMAHPHRAHLRQSQGDLKSPESQHVRTTRTPSDPNPSLDHQLS